MTAAQSLAAISDLLERALAYEGDPRDARGLIIQAHTHAVLQCVHQRRVEARQVFAELSHLEHGTIQ